MTNTNAHLPNQYNNLGTSALSAAFDLACNWYMSVARHLRNDAPETHPDNVKMIHLSFIWYSMLCEMDGTDVESELVECVEHEGSLLEALLVCMYG